MEDMEGSTHARDFVCVACGSKIIENNPELSQDEGANHFYQCKQCLAENGRLHFEGDGLYLLYPSETDESLFRHFTPVQGLVAEGYWVGDIIRFRTSRQRPVEAEVLFVNATRNMMLIQDTEGKRQRRLLIERQILEEAYRKTSLPSNFVQGWKHRAINLQTMPREIHRGQ